MAAQRSRRSERSERGQRRDLNDGSARRFRVATRSGRQAKTLKMTSLQARHGPARPAVRNWLASFLIDFLLLR